MSKVTINPIASDFRSSTQLSADLSTLADAFDNTLSRDGSGPNQMNASIDLNGYPILNVPAPVRPNDVVRLQDLTGFSGTSSGGGGSGGASVTGIVSLVTFAATAGIPLDGSVSIQPAINLAHAAMAAATGLGGLYVWIPPGSYSFQYMFGYNRCGFYCDVGTVRLSQTWDGTHPIFSLAPGQSYATGVLFWGFKHITGNFVYVDETSPNLFKYPNSITNSAEPETGAQLGQQGVYLHWAFSGVSDPTYVANSADGHYSQLPRSLIAHIGIFDIGGDAFNISGAGASDFDNLTCENIGGRGLAINGYDSNYSNIDLGGCGLEGVSIGPNGSVIRLSPIKAWFSGTRAIVGHQMSLRLDRCGQVDLFGNFQDPTGQAIYGQGCTNCQIIATVGWQNGAAPMLFDNALLELDGFGFNSGGPCSRNQFILNGVKSNAPNALRLIRTNQVSGVWPTYNQIILNHTGFENDFGIWNDQWFVGNLDTNYIVSNGSLRQPVEHVGGDGGLYNIFTTGATNSGLIFYGNRSSYPGRTLLISSGSSGGQVQQFIQTGTKASGTLTSTQNYTNGDTFTINGNVYTLHTTLLNVNPREIHIGATEAATMTNITNALNGSGGVRGTDYSWQTFAETNTIVTNDGSHVITFTFPYPGTGGNAITFTASCAHATASGATFTGGTASVNNWYDVMNWGPVGTTNGGFAFGAGTPVAHPIASANQAAVVGSAGATYTAAEQAILNACVTWINQHRLDSISDNQIKGSA